MDTISAGSLEGQAPDSPATPVELQPFVRAMGRMLQRLSEAMRQQRNFVAYASHELRTPLAVAKSTLQAAHSQRRSAPEYALAIERAMEDLERLERLAEQLLVLARLEGPIDESAWQPVSLKDLVGDLGEQYLAMAARTGGTIRWQTLPGQVRGDADQLERMVSNLIDNAIKHGPERGEVTVSMHQPDYGHVCIRVHDAGGAIPATAIGRLFDPFFRVSGARDRATGGAGLGLAMVREIVHRHHGQVAVRSTPQTGTEFVITLPCLPEPARAAGA